MILVDANLLIYAEDHTSPKHAEARSWWDARLSGREPVCLCWPVLSAFIRLTTNRRVFKTPLTIEQATERVQSWLNQPCARLIGPTSGHWEIFRGLLRQAQASGNLVSDAHIGALAIEHSCELCSTDADFARFPRVRWRNPLPGGSSQ